MSHLSAFAPLGMLHLSGAPTHAENIYRSMRTSLVGAFSFEEGALADAWSYATAMMHGRIKYAAAHAGGQALPATIDIMLPPVERACGLVPGPHDTIAERRAAYATRRRIPKAPSKYLVNTTLRELLGDAFITTAPTSIDDAVIFPDGFGDAPMLLLPATTQRKVVRVLDPMFEALAGEGTFRYESVLPVGDDGTGLLEVGDSLIVEPDVEGNAELVFVSAVGVDADGARTFSCVYEVAHSEGCIAAQQPFPAQVSTKRHTVVVLTPAAAADAASRRKVDEFMSRAMRASSTWSIVGGTAGDGVSLGGTGTFVIGESGIGIQSMDEYEYP